MSGLLFLTTNDFHVQKGNKGMILCHQVKGFCLILFYSPQCRYCRELLPIFKRLPLMISGCQFGMVNISQNNELISISKNTVTNITHVPYIILYVDGIPLIKYTGDYQEEEIKEFIFDATKKLKARQQFMDTRDREAGRDSSKIIPKYTVGQPLYGDNDDSYKLWNGRDYVEPIDISCHYKRG